MSLSPDGRWWWDGHAWCEVGPDGRYYHDGSRWVLVPGIETLPVVAPLRAPEVDLGAAPRRGVRGAGRRVRRLPLVGRIAVPVAALLGIAVVTVAATEMSWHTRSGGANARSSGAAVVSPRPTADASSAPSTTSASTSATTTAPARRPTLTPTPTQTPRPTPVPTATSAPTAPPPTPAPTAASASPPPPPITTTITSVTSPVAPNSTATLTARTGPGANCAITVTYASGVSTAGGLHPTTADSGGIVTWTWKVGRLTPPGTYPIHVDCGAAGTADATFTVS